MKKILIVTSALALSVIAGDTFAQTGKNWKLHMGYNIAAPLGGLKNDFISNTSFKGAIGELSYSINPKFSLGLSSGFQNYYQKYGREIYHTAPNEAISAVVSNSLEIIPILLKGSFSPAGGTAAIKPYVSLAAGVNIVNYSQYLGEFPTSEASGTFAAQAGLGVMVPFSKAQPQTGIKIGGTYNYGAYNRNGISQLNSIGANLGVVFTLK